MAVTTQRRIYQELLVDLRGLTGVHDDYIFMTPVPLFMQVNKTVVQLIPGVPNIATEDVGVGLVEEDFKVVVWTQVWLDQTGHSTEKMTNATYGVMKLMETVREQMIQSDANGYATVPVRWISGSTPQETADAPGWIYYEDTYRVGYEVDWDYD